jgi:hypothetical protein
MAKKKAENVESREKYFIGQRVLNNCIIAVEEDSYESMADVMEELVQYNELSIEQMQDIVVFKGEMLAPKIGELKPEYIKFLSEDDPAWNED